MEGELGILTSAMPPCTHGHEIPLQHKTVPNRHVNQPLGPVLVGLPCMGHIRRRLDIEEIVGPDESERGSGRDGRRIAGSDAPD